MSTHRREIEELAEKIGAEIRCDDDGRIVRVYWGSRAYGDGALRGSLLTFAEEARAAVAQLAALGMEYSPR